MIKICSLDFINKNTFETDIKLADGRVVCAKGDKVTPELILRLYFKDIYVEQKLADEKTEKRSRQAEERLDENVLKAEFNSPEFASSVAGSTKEAKELAGPSFGEFEAKTAQGVSGVSFDFSGSSKEAVEVPSLEDDPIIKFDEDQAKRLSKMAVNLGKKLNFDVKELEELEKAAYYFNIGVTKFRKSQISQRNFKKDKALAGYDILLNEKQMPEKVAETVKFSVYNYDSSSFKLTEKIPYSHIVSIVGYYDESVNKNNSKERTLDKMTRMGIRKFNTFVLHKFVRMILDERE